MHKASERGQGLVEYALILVLVSVVVIGVLMILGPNIGNIFSKINSNLAGLGGGEVQTAVPTLGANEYYTLAALCAAHPGEEEDHLHARYKLLPDGRYMYVAYGSQPHDGHCTP